MEEKTNTSEDIKMSLGTAIFIAVCIAALITVGIIWISLKIKGTM